MRGAFVVRLLKASEGSQMEGSVEEVDTGKQSQFRTEKELIAFLRERFTRICHEKNGHNDHRL